MATTVTSRSRTHHPSPSPPPSEPLIQPPIQPLTSLAGIRAGDVVEVRAILFDSLRAQCSALGYAEGTVVRCRSAGRASLLLVTPDGRTVPVDRDAARFIQVSRVNGAAGAQRSM
jgi:hypothetical protein